MEILKLISRLVRSRLTKRRFSKKQGKIMKKIQFAALACLILSAAFLPSASANHRTGSIIAPELLVAGDFNQDGKMDLAVNCTGFDVVAILFGDGQGGFTLGGHFPTDTLTKGLQAGDVNRDGHLDLVSATNWGYDENILLGDGLGSFHVPTPPSEIDGDGEPVRLLLRDFNNDGRLDIFVNAPDDDAVVLYFGDGKGNFPGPDLEIEGVQQPYGMDAGDLNGDGKLDVAFPKTGTQMRHEFSTSVFIFFGDGHGHLSAGPVLTVGQEPHTVIAVDVNHDGHLDLAVTNRTDGTVTVLLGDGHGNFTVSSTTSVLSPIP